MSALRRRLMMQCAEQSVDITVLEDVRIQASYQRLQYGAGLNTYQISVEPGATYTINCLTYVTYLRYGYANEAWSGTNIVLTDYTSLVTSTQQFTVTVPVGMTYLYIGDGTYTVEKQ